MVLTETNEYVVSLELEDSGKEKFAEATTRLAGNGVISIWMDDTLISYPEVNEAITDGQAMISGGFTAETAKDLADRINSGALPFQLETVNYNTINPTLGLGAKDAMVLAGFIAFADVYKRQDRWGSTGGGGCIGAVAHLIGTCGSKSKVTCASRMRYSRA